MQILSLLLLCVVVGRGCNIDWLCQKCVESGCFFVTMDGENHLCLDSFSPDLSGVAKLVTPGSGIMCPSPSSTTSSPITPATTSVPASSSSSATTSLPPSSSSSTTPATATTSSSTTPATSSSTTPATPSSSTTTPSTVSSSKTPATASISPLEIFWICLASLVSAALFLIVMLIMMRRKHHRMVEDFNQHDIL